MPLSPKIAMAHASHLRGHGTEVKTTGAAVAAADGTPSKKALPAQETSSVGWLRPAPGPAKPQHTLHGTGPGGRARRELLPLQTSGG